MSVSYRTPLPDGRVATRTSATDRYTHLVVSFADYPASANAWALKHHASRWLAAGYCGSWPLADKLASKWRAKLLTMGCTGIDVRILPIERAS